MQSNLAMMESTEFEEKVDIDLFLPSEPTKSAEIEINDVKEEPLEDQHAIFESDQDLQGQPLGIDTKQGLLN